MEKLELSLTQLYEIERLGRAIEELDDIGQLKEICKQMLRAWMTQKAACNWLMRQNLSAPPTVRSLD